MSGTLNLHAGGHVCTRSELASYEPPPETATYRPISHIKTLVLVEELLSRCGYRIQTERLAVDRRGARFFSVIDVDSEIVEGITLAIGLRSSYDMSYPFGLVGGSRTFVCSNLAFSADLINVRSKHTKNGLSRFERATFDAIAGLDQYREIERKRFETYRQVEIDDRDASHLLLTAYREDVVSHRYLRRIWDHWTEPKHDFGPKSLFRLFQAFTSAVTDRVKSNPIAFSRQTIRLHELLKVRGGDEPVIDVTPPEDPDGQAPEA